MFPSAATAKYCIPFSVAAIVLLAAAVSDAALQSNLLQQEKRAPSGFMGMRGKKSSYSLEAARPDEEEYYQEWSELEPEFEGQRDKKAPAGFMGMRGKKAPSGFLGLRGKKETPQNLNDLLLALSNRYRNSYGYKRAPLGFLGMRGRRSDPSMEVSQDFQAQKRAPYGFMGMRG